MNRCHKTKDPKTGKLVLIPRCWETVRSMNIEDCNCEDSFITNREVIKYKKKYIDEIKERLEVETELLQAKQEIDRLNEVLATIEKERR